MDASFRKNFSGRILLALLCLALMAGCASPRPSHRRGWFDQVDGEGGSRQPASRIDPAQAAAQLKLEWPLKNVRMTSSFGSRGSNFHEGIDLHAPIGTSVLAAQSGVVLYAGHQISGYGNLIVIRHGSGFSTVYAHNSRLLVIRGQKVRQGQRIALSGNTGHSTGPHLHFEVRQGETAVNPVKFLPKMAVARGEPSMSRKRRHRSAKRQLASS